MNDRSRAANGCPARLENVKIGGYTDGFRTDTY